MRQRPQPTLRREELLHTTQSRGKPDRLEVAGTLAYTRVPLYHHTGEKGMPRARQIKLPRY